MTIALHDNDGDGRTTNTSLGDATRVTVASLNDGELTMTTLDNRRTPMPRLVAMATERPL